MRFFETVEGLHYSIDCIERIGAERKQKLGRSEMEYSVHSVSLKDGGSVVIYASTAKDIIQQPTAIIPAAAGTYLIYPGEYRGDEVHMANVIAWGLSDEGMLVPITPSGVNDGVSNDTVILTPDGRVCRPGCDDHKSLDDFLNSHFPPPTSDPAQ